MIDVEFSVSKNIFKADLFQQNCKDFATKVGIFGGYASIGAVSKGSGFKEFANGKLRYVLRKSKTKLVDVANRLNTQYGIFKHSKKFTKTKEFQLANKILVEHIMEENAKKRWGRQWKNLLLAAFRVPILKHEYGRNSEMWSKVKGFDWPMMFTGTFFKNIKAKFIKGDNV